MPRFVKREVKEEPEKKRLVVEEQPTAPAEVKVEEVPVVVAAPVEPAAEAVKVEAVVEPAAMTEVESKPAPSMEGWVKVPEEKLAGGEAQAVKKGVPGGVVFLLGILIGVAVGGGVILGWQKWGGVKTGATVPKTEAAVTPVLTVAAKVSPTPDLSGLKRSNLKVRVENGSGVSGAASTAGDYLTGLGYTVVSVGNSTQSAAVTSVGIVTDKADYGGLLLKDLGEKYTVASASVQLSGSGDYDALVTIGK